MLTSSMLQSCIVKNLIFVILFNISCTKRAYSNEFMSEAECFIDLSDIRNNKEYIIYEFGFSKISSVYIIKNETHFDVYISDGNRVNFSTTDEIPPILNWAFDKAPNELASARFNKNYKFEPLYYKLAVVVNDTAFIIDSSNLRIIGNESFEKKIDELKSFILGLWIDSFEAQNID